MVTLVNPRRAGCLDTFHFYPFISFGVELNTLFHFLPYKHKPITILCLTLWKSCSNSFSWGCSSQINMVERKQLKYLVSKWHLWTMQEEVPLSCLTSLRFYDHFLFLKFFYFLPNSINKFLFSAYAVPSSVLGILGGIKEVFMKPF